MADPTLEAGGTTLDVEHIPMSCAPDSVGQLALVVLWWRGQPARSGELLLPGTEPSCFGRDGKRLAEPRLSLVRQRPGANLPAAPLLDPFLSRRHLRLRSLGCGRALLVENLGRRPLAVNGTERGRAEVQSGDLIELHSLCTFACVERPAQLAAALPVHYFGEPDADAIVGEGPSIWSLRRQVEFTAERAAHVLITGPSGAGKELVARAIHQHSARRRRPLIARNAATIPPSLADAELFGNAPSYPNAGMAERPGLVGQAEGSTLFLDEIGELPLDVQAHLLRVLDAGEYQRLGDARPRVADVRFIAATNRPVSSLKSDLAARFALHIRVPGLDQRIEDLPLLARHMVRSLARRDPALGQRFLEGWDGSAGEPRFSGELIRALVLHQYATHVRELESVLLLSMQSSTGGVLECTSEVREVLRLPVRGRDPDAVSREELLAAIDRHGGVRERVWRELGLSSRHALARLMRKLGEA